MSNKVQLTIQLAGLSLAVLTMVMSFSKPVYDKLDSLNERISVIETHVKYMSPRNHKE